MSSHEVGVIGLGVTGLAAILTLIRYTNVQSVIGIERRPGPAQVNSSRENNSQTLHMGRAESNYGLEQALAVDGDAQHVVGFIEQFAPEAGKPMATHMIAVGSDEVEAFRKRFEMLSPHFPDLHLLERAQIAMVAPKLIEGRDENEPIVSLYSEAGYAVDFQSLGEAMLRVARETAERMGKTLTILFDTGIEYVERTDDGFAIYVDGARHSVRTLEIAAGNGSLLIAHQLGFGHEYALLPVAGSYFVTRASLRAKVYGFQDPEIPFAAAHADPDVNDLSVMRFGPTAKPLPLLERGSWRTTYEFLRVGTLAPRGLWGVARVLLNAHLLAFGIKNMLYELPLVGVYFFAALAARKIVPTIRARDLRIAKGAGGIRGQLVDVNAGKLMKAERIPPPEGMPCNCIPAPSPGASKCLGGAIVSVRNHVRWLGPEYAFDEDRMRAELRRTNYALPAAAVQ
jgi:malate dehydrogenase (quinone)